MISSWPARGGVVIQDGIVYFGASIWPFMGTFLYALDAKTGTVIWQNLGTGSTYMKQPHDSPAFAGVAPQGAMAISRDYLLVSGGRSVPACFNRHSGELVYYHLAANNKTGGAFVCANEDYFFNHSRDRNTTLYNLAEGYSVLQNIGDYPVLNQEVFYFSGETITVRSAKSPDDKLAEYSVDASGDLIKAGSRLYAGGKNQITAFRLHRNGEDPELSWQKPIDGLVARLIAADGKLFGVTLDGKLLAFGSEPRKTRFFPKKISAPKISARTRDHVRRILDQTQISDGYALVWGIERDDFLIALAATTALNIVAVDPSADKIQKLRKQLNQAGLYGKRVSLLSGTPDSVNLPPYFAALIVINQSGSGQFYLKKLFNSLRPYGGKIWLPANAHSAPQIEQEVRNDELAGAEMISVENAVVITREGPLPGASDWTHQYGDIANSVKSDDELVQLPLGVLWFGGSSNVDVLPRHGHGPPEQVVGGRLFIPGMDRLSARDVYTGRVLWNTLFDSTLTSGIFFDNSYTNTPLVPTYNQEHLPGANARGTVFVAAPDWVYVIKQDSCLVLDTATGQQVNHFTLPPASNRSETHWGFIGLNEQHLIAGADFVAFSEFNPAKALDEQEYSQLSQKKKKSFDRFQNYDQTASKRLLVLNRFDGAIKWEIPANYGFLHNAIVASPGSVFCLDKLPPFFEQKFERRGLSLPENFRLLALDIETGKILWEVTEDIFGSWLGFSAEHDLLLQATRPSRDMLSGEDGKRLIVYDAKTGAKIWDEKINYSNPPILHHRKIITDGAAYDLFTGKPIQQIDPLTHESIPWTYTRTYGCNYNIASEYLLSFRSAAAGFYDLMRQGGTGNFGGFKSGCTSNLVVADGVLNAPDYTRTCQCAYQNQTSLALVHLPELEYWTNTTLDWNGKQIRQIGLNFNAPGDRLADNKTLWLDFPSVGGDSPQIPVSLEPQNPKMIRLHSAFITAENQPWVAASGMAGVKKIMVELSEKDLADATYTIILHFAELEAKLPGERVFDVSLQGQRILPDFDIVKEAGQPNTSVVKIFKGIPVKRKLHLEFQPAATAPDSQPIICGVEAIAE
jgi:outer membrane protein assembly factor BamB